jgi:hypothetical protein
MYLNTQQKYSVVSVVMLVIFWTALFVTGTKEGFYNYLYSFLFGLIPFFSGIIAMLSAQQWGGIKTAIGKAVFFIGLGIFLWGCGENIWSFYNFFMDIPAPYPSIADLGFAPSIFFYGLGAFYLSKVTGAKFGLRNVYAKIFIVIAPIILLALSYYVFIVVARAGVLIPEGETILKAILDIAYPLGDFIAVTLVAVITGLSFKYMGGRYTLDIISILLGLTVMTAADFIFSYTTTVGTYYNGNIGDLMLTIGLFLLSFGVLGFSKINKS